MKRVYIWGTGKYLEIVYKSINQDICIISGIVDRNKDKQGKNVFGDICVDSPEILQHVELDYILISAKNYWPIIEDCKTIGITDDKILIFWENQKELFEVVDEKAKKIIDLEEQLQISKWKLESLPYELGVENGPKIKSSEELLEHIIQNRVSLCRFGDGEFEIMRERERPWFQHVDRNLSQRLIEIIHSDNASIAIAIANNFGNLDCYTEKAANAIREYLFGNTRREVMNFFEPDRVYFDAYVSRPYLMYRDKGHAKIIFDMLKKIWNKKSVIIVEGRNSKMGVGNDFFADTEHIRRIICPEKNAFDFYEDIFNSIRKHISGNELVLISLGPTATVLAYDLGSSGIQTLDIGQIDNEYEWFLRNAVERIEIPGKGVAELSWWHHPKDVIQDKNYEEQIIDKIGID